jgi:hypothetical protein
LNQPLADGERGTELVAWLNSLPKAQQQSNPSPTSGIRISFVATDLSITLVVSRFRFYCTASCREYTASS